MNHNGLRPPRGAAKRKSGSSPLNFHHAMLSNSPLAFPSPGVSPVLGGPPGKMSNLASIVDWTSLIHCD
uniref:Uncharacterized protein n=1 Tax=Lepeophtheirus salmonis TaxID=72036 RepID=A0A0K2UFB8_LEPSM